MTFGNLWQEQFDAMGRAALTWYPGSRIDPAIQNAFSYYILIRTTFLKRFQQKQQILLSLFVASCGILLIVSRTVSLRNIRIRQAHICISDQHRRRSRIALKSSSNHSLPRGVGLGPPQRLVWLQLEGNFQRFLQLSEILRRSDLQHDPVDGNADHHDRRIAASRVGHHIGPRFVLFRSAAFADSRLVYSSSSAFRPSYW